MAGTTIGLDLDHARKLDELVNSFKAKGRATLINGWIEAHWQNLTSENSELTPKQKFIFKAINFPLSCLLQSRQCEPLSTRIRPIIEQMDKLFYEAYTMKRER